MTMVLVATRLDIIGAGISQCLGTPRGTDGCSSCRLVLSPPQSVVTRVGVCTLCFVCVRRWTGGGGV